ncbi:uncharacterized protein FA14DRAFT_188042 [Meira miltonrushii]|uniref:Uncharacterized protein n=1 Tax=Meira miltonrushii TaxID=1280837 RepID=A0A316VR82_9BASI|nr:uncharacterized protein FA14DRAFT_188042 [Meira miltonrushii]PWN38005.1 hypothetical protein FA14DRAFT_188042 [Meira miltonrushii]
MASLISLSDSLSQWVEQTSEHHDNPVRPVHAKTEKYFEWDNGSAKVKSEGILRPDSNLVSGQIERVPLGPSSHPTFKINFDLLYGDGRKTNFIPVEDTRMLYKKFLKKPRPFPAGKAETKDKKAFQGAYGITYITLSIPTPVWVYIVESVITDIKKRTDVTRDPNLAHRFRTTYVEVNRGYTTFHADMKDKIPRSDVNDVTNKMKANWVNASGLGYLGVHLSQVRNPEKSITWELKFRMYRLDNERYYNA